MQKLYKLDELICLQLQRPFLWLLGIKLSNWCEAVKNSKNHTIRNIFYDRKNDLAKKKLLSTKHKIAIFRFFIFYSWSQTTWLMSITCVWGFVFWVDKKFNKCTCVKIHSVQRYRSSHKKLKNIDKFVKYWR